MNIRQGIRNLFRSPRQSGGPRLRVMGQTPAYEAASTTRRASNWTPTTEAINAIVAGNVSTMISKSRDLMRKNPWAISAVDSYVANAIGTGIRPKFKHQDPEIKKLLQQLWEDWTDDSDASETTDFYGQQALALRSVMEGGDIITRYRPRLPQDGLAIPLQLQILESEHMPSGKYEMLASGNVIKGGIEFDRIGRRVAYHLYREHPGEMQLMRANALELVRVPATSANMMFRPIRPNQLRGIPWLAVVLMRLWELDKFDDAELMKQQVAAMFSGFLEKTNPDDELFGGSASTETNDDGTPQDNILMAPLEPLTIQEVPQGSRMTWSTPPQNGSYEPVMRTQLQSIAAGAGSMYEQLTGDYSRVNFSSIRAGINEFRRKCAQIQFSMVVFQFCRPTLRQWMDAAALSGAIDAKDYAKNRREYLRVEWMPDRWPYVNPQQDVEAEKQLVLNGFKSRASVVSEMGSDIEVVDEENARDNARADALKLVYATDGRKALAKSAAPEPAPDMPSTAPQKGALNNGK